MNLRKWCELLHSADHMAEKFGERKGSYSVNEEEAEMIRDLYRLVLSMQYDYVKLQGEESMSEFRRTASKADWERYLDTGEE